MSDSNFSVNESLKVGLLKQTIEIEENEENKEEILCVIETFDLHFIVIKTQNISELYQIYDTSHKINIVGKITSQFDEINKVHELMILHGVAFVRGSIYTSQKMTLEEANFAIRIITYLKGDEIVVNKKLDRTIIETYMLLLNRFTIEEIAEMKSLKYETVLSHIKKANKLGIKIHEKNFEEYFEDTCEGIDFSNLEETI